MLSSPKDIFASCFTKSYDFSNSSFEYATLIPLPPPPADAFKITGYFIFSANSIASSLFFINPSDPGTTGTPAFFIVSFAFDLFPNKFINSPLGPINFIPISLQILAKLAFSDKNPKPG